MRLRARYAESGTDIAYGGRGGGGGDGARAKGAAAAGQPAQINCDSLLPRTDCAATALIPRSGF
eukprot:3016906-Rhodomonas_salina.1